MAAGTDLRLASLDPHQRLAAYVFFLRRPQEPLRTFVDASEFALSLRISTARLTITEAPQCLALKTRQSPCLRRLRGFCDAPCVKGRCNPEICLGH